MGPPFHSAGKLQVDGGGKDVSLCSESASAAVFFRNGPDREKPYAAAGPGGEKFSFRSPADMRETVVHGNGQDPVREPAVHPDEGLFRFFACSHGVFQKVADQHAQIAFQLRGGQSSAGICSSRRDTDEIPARRAAA